MAEDKKGRAEIVAGEKKIGGTMRYLKVEKKKTDEKPL